jgi:hypothetical protein
MTNAIAAVAAKHNIPWDRDPWSVGPEICTAVILDAMSRVPCPGGLEVGCVIPPTTVPSLTAPAPPAPPSNGTRVIAGRRTLLRQIKPAPPRIVAAKDALRRVATTEAGMEPEPPPAGPPAQDLPMDDPTIRYLYIGVGVLVVGGVAAYFIMRKK